MSATTTGIVLAGGRSSRMGRDKALLDWQGRPLIEHMIDLLREAGIARIRISGDRPDYTGIPDQRPDAGPVVGLLSVADTLDDGHVLVVPVDMPKLDATLLRRLIKAPEAACVRFDDIPLPMRLRLDDETRDALRRTAASDGRERSFRALQQRIELHTAPIRHDEAARLGNCNTPQDWQKATRP
ncbi:MAG TPA: molybdenum cofactor guanylyltransferase [Arenimonas sp.]|nr:molybdenum cofactor guanylyltransferase [Arenimonas sp.]